MSREVEAQAIKIPCGFHTRTIKEAAEKPRKTSTNALAGRI
jgi:hypothetical protein